MAIDQIFSVVKEYFPATLGAIIGAWNKRGEKNSLKHLLETTSLDKLSVTFIAIFAIVIGVCIGKWVSLSIDVVSKRCLRLLFSPLLFQAPIIAPRVAGK